ncbi:MAG TPA: DUF2637 domain-containing protein [Streptomyces sp.]|nr:DUF2637 domain-containing protein [Streptomyces sp.]
MQAVRLTRTHRILIGVVVAGAVVIAAIGFAGSYAAVRDLAEQKGFGRFAPFFPIGVDAGIVVLLALDLLLTWIRIPFPMLRQTAWLLTAATIAFNGAAAWPDPLGVGMHSVIPVLFVVTVEAARHAIGRIADITADRHMEGVRLARWLLAFPSTFRLWRRMKLWELRSYDQVIRMEQDRLVYEARLRARYGRGWKRRAPVEALMPLRLARYGVPLSRTGAAGLAAAGIEALPVLSVDGAQDGAEAAGDAPGQVAALEQAAPEPAQEPAAQEPTVQEPAVPVAEPAPGQSPPAHQAAPRPAPVYAAEEPHGPTVTVPVTPGGRRRTLGQAQAGGPSAPVPAARREVRPEPEPEPEPEAVGEPVGIPDGVPREDFYYAAYQRFIAEQGTRPTARQLARALHERDGVTYADGGLLSEGYLREYLREFKDRYNAEMGLAG